MRQTTSAHDQEYVYSCPAARLAHAVGWDLSNGLNPCPAIDRTYRGYAAPRRYTLLGAPVGSTGHGLSHPHNTTQLLAPMLGGHSHLVSGLDAAILCIQLLPFSPLELVQAVPITRDIAMAQHRSRGECTRS